MDIREAEHLLMNELLKHINLKRIADLAAEVLGNPLSIIDASWNEPIHSTNYPLDDLEDKVHHRSNISKEEYKKNMLFVNSIILKGTPQIVAWPYMRRKRLYCGSIVNGIPMGGIRLPDVGKDLEKINPELIILVAKIAGLALIMSGWPRNGYLADAQSLIWGILNDELSLPHIRNDLLPSLFSGIRSYRMVWCPLYNSNGVITEEKQLEEISPIVGHWWQVSTQNGYVILVDGEEDASKLEKLSEEAERRTLILGASDVFLSLEDLKRQLDTAQKTVRYALHSGNRSGLRFFNDYKIFGLIDVMREQGGMERYQHSAVRWIDNYDAEHNTEYGKTLRVYLENGMDPGVVSGILAVHRNTVVYRINRLCEIFRIDLRDIRELSSLYYTLLSMDTF